MYFHCLIEAIKDKVHAESFTMFALGRGLITDALSFHTLIHWHKIRGERCGVRQGEERAVGESEGKGDAEKEKTGISSSNLCKHELLLQTFVTLSHPLHKWCRGFQHVMM